MKDKKELDKSLVSGGVDDNKPAFTWQDCKNCGFHFEGQYCPSCGQSIKEYQQPMSQFIGDFLASLFALDVRLYKTIPTLLFKPGVLSSEYLAGKRKKHVAPFRMYFFISIVFFFLLGYQTTRVVDREVSMDELNQAQGSLIKIKTDDELRVKLDSSNQAGDLGKKVILADQIRNELKRQLEEEKLTPEERANREKWVVYLGSPQVIINKVFQYVSWAFFVLMPWLAVLLFLFFKKRRRFYVEHLVYSVNLHTFLFLLLSLLALIGIVFPLLMDRLSGYVFILVLVYLVIGIRRYYSQKWVWAIIKSLSILIVYLVSSFILLGGSIILILTIL